MYIYIHIYMYIYMYMYICIGSRLGVPRSFQEPSVLTCRTRLHTGGLGVWGGGDVNVQWKTSMEDVLMW